MRRSAPGLMSQSKAFTRRKLLKVGVGSALLLSLVERRAHAAGRLSVKDPQAVGFGYVENAKQADAKRFPNYRQGQSCANCKLVAARYGFYRRLFRRISVTNTRPTRRARSKPLGLRLRQRNLAAMHWNALKTAVSVSARR